MRISQLFLALTCLLASCGSPDSTSYERANAPWVFRSVLDGQPRMVTLALNDNLWVAYSAQNGSLYKAWKGGVNFDGAVYTTVHGPQPSSLGDAWIESTQKEPWTYLQNGNPAEARLQYKGHKFEKGQAWLHYQLHASPNDVIDIWERPEYITSAEGLTGLERTFKTANVPEGGQVQLSMNLSSIALESNITTTGNWTKTESTPRDAKGLHGLDITGQLVLNSNGETNFTTIFTSKPLLENQNKVEGAEEETERPIGYRLIARNDCKTCHNTFVATVGPSYMDVAKKYRNTPENVATLVAKVKSGGSGVWGEAAMNDHANVADADIRFMVEYVMSLDSLEESKLAVIESAPVEKDLVFQDPDSIAENQIFPGAVARAYGYDREVVQLSDLNPVPAQPIFSGIIPTLHTEGEDLAGTPDNFVVIAEGYINIPKSNNYLFRLISDDGSRLVIGDNEVINNDGLHGATPIDGEVALAKGYHPFRMEYFNHAGGKMFSLQWKSFDSGAFEVVPPTVIMHHVKQQEGIDPSGMVDSRRIPGDGSMLLKVHPSYDLSQARPDDFYPKVAGIDFLSDGRMVVSTWDAAGPVYILEGVESGDPSKITVKQIAEGLAEPLGLRVVDDEIYVLQKQELTHLIDHDGDEIIDEYETLSNDWRVSANFHEFCFGMAYKDGYFYASTAIAILPGGASAQPQIPDRGKAMKISRADGSVEFISHGLRTPNGVGLGKDGEVFIADNQGDWLPASKIVHVRDGAFFGSHAVDPEGTADLKMDPPVVWLPQDEIGNSPSTPSYLNDGPYAGQMIHGEVTHGGVKRVFVEKVAGEYQGCVFRFIQGLEAGVNRLEWGPDGALYIGGIGSTGNWRQNGKLWYGLQRLKYNDKSTFEMLAVRAKSDGMEIEFTEPLPVGVGGDPKEYDVQQWWYLPTNNYGGPKMDEENLAIRSINISDDRKKIFLELDGMKPEHLIYIHLPSSWVSDLGGEIWTTEAWYTLNNIPEGQNGFRSAPIVANTPNSLNDAEKAAGWELLFNGTNFDGWHRYNGGEIGANWKVLNGAITLTTTPKAEGGWEVKDGGYIVTDGKFDNYELRMEWKIQACGNSGVIYNVVEDPKYSDPWMTGPEMQVLDNTCHPDAKYPKHRAGDLYDLIECEYEAVYQAGNWNQVRLIKQGNHVEHWLNGRKLVEFEMATPEWTEMLANSKWKDYPDFGKSLGGSLALQDHGDQVWFRNIKIKSLEPVQ
ncbi:MAG: DUF1080 domain-containing protein [Saprospiraceae bacterium]|nr:DUF1080 domain-containing protein [Saprospiraceae bacterium]